MPLISTQLQEISGSPYTPKRLGRSIRGEEKGKHGQRLLQMTSGLPSCQVKMPRVGMNGGKELRRSMQRPTCPEVETDDN